MAAAALDRRTVRGRVSGRVSSARTARRPRGDGPGCWRRSASPTLARSGYSPCSWLRPEAAASWGGLLAKLQQRGGLPAPLLVVTDGHAGLKKALETWPPARVQRCTAHKGRNLADACPVHARPELRGDYHRLLYATDGLAARAAYDAFLKKWTPLCPPVARSLEEAGLELLTFYTFPKAMWKSVRTTNALENLNRDFRRRTKTQASFSTEAAALTVLFGLRRRGPDRLP